MRNNEDFYNLMYRRKAPAISSPQMPAEFTRSVPPDVAASFVPQDAANSGESPSGSKIAAGALQSVAQAFSQPSEHPPMQLMPVQQYEQGPRVMPIGIARLPRFEQGGYLGKRRVGLVGESGPEMIETLPKGGVQITPLSRPLSPTFPTGSPVTLPQLPQIKRSPIETVGGLESVPVTQSAVPVPLPSVPSDNPISAVPPRTYIPDSNSSVRLPSIGGMQQPPPSILTAPAPDFGQKLNELDQARAERDYIADSKEKTNPWLNGLFVALQGIEKMFTPNDKPIQSLGEVRKAGKLQKANEKVERIEKRQQTRQKEADDALEREYRQAQLAKIRSDVARQQEDDRQAGMEWEPIDVNGYVYKKFKRGGAMEPLVVDGKQVESEGYWTPSPSGTDLIDRKTGKTKPASRNLGKPVKVTARDITDLFPKPTMTAADKKNSKKVAAYNARQSDIAKLAGAVESQGALTEKGQVISRNELQQLFEGYRKDGKLDTLLKLLASGAVNVR